MEKKENQVHCLSRKKPAILIFVLYASFLLLVLQNSSCSTLSISNWDGQRIATVDKAKYLRRASPEIKSYIDIVSPKEFQPKRRFLLFSNLGSRSGDAVRSWMGASKQENNLRLFDAVFYYFDPHFPSPSDCPGDFCLNREGFKWPALYHFLTESGLEPNAYDAIFAVDDDISMPLREINEMFTLFMSFKLIFAQPSYDGEVSDLHFPRIQRWRGNTIVRYTNFVENAAMVIHFPTMIDKLMPIMRQSISGWGIDYCFFHVSGADIHEIGTIHTVKAIHPPSTQVTKASQAYAEGSEEILKLNKYGGLVGSKESVNRLEGEHLLKSCGALMYTPKVFFRVRPGEDRDSVITREKENYPEYRSYNLVKSKW